MTPAKLPIALVDDHTLFRSALADMVGSFGYDVVVEAGNGREYVDAVEGGARVAVAVVDLHMPVMDGYSTLEWIRTHAPGTRALALTFERTEEAMVRALRAGACGFLRKDADREQFKEALDSVARVGHYLNETVLDEEGTLVEQSTSYAQSWTEIHALITEREKEFVRLVCDETEYTYEQMAQLMGVSVRTVNGYRESIFSKFHIKSKTGLVIFAYKWGIMQV